MNPAKIMDNARLAIQMQDMIHNWTTELLMFQDDHSDQMEMNRAFNQAMHRLNTVLTDIQTVPTIIITASILPHVPK